MCVNSWQSCANNWFDSVDCALTLVLALWKRGIQRRPLKSAFGLSFAARCCVFQNKKTTLGADRCHLEEILTILRPPPPTLCLSLCGPLWGVRFTLGIKMGVIARPSSMEKWNQIDRFNTACWRWLIHPAVDSSVGKWNQLTNQINQTVKQFFFVCFTAKLPYGPLVM